MEPFYGGCQVRTPLPAFSVIAVLGLRNRPGFNSLSAPASLR